MIIDELYFKLRNSSESGWRGKSGMSFCFRVIYGRLDFARQEIEIWGWDFASQRSVPCFDDVMKRNTSHLYEWWSCWCEDDVVIDLPHWSLGASVPEPDLHHHHEPRLVASQEGSYLFRSYILTHPTLFIIRHDFAVVFLAVFLSQLMLFLFQYFLLRKSQEQEKSITSLWDQPLLREGEYINSLAVNTP
jgi:hypothetical protein